jgi:CcmD family protein
MEANGKIFVVVAVLAVILTGIFVYLFLLDRKVRKLEKQAEEKQEKKES